MSDEINALVENNTYEFTPVPRDKKLLEAERYTP